MGRCFLARASALACLFSAVAVPLHVHAAQSGSRAIEEIVVSADYRQSDVNDIPASVSVLDADLIRRKNAQHLEDILLNAPNVNFASGASRARFLQIRGIECYGHHGVFDFERRAGQASPAA